MAAQFSNPIIHFLLEKSTLPALSATAFSSSTG
jgi:hypothetical protein